MIFALSGCKSNDEWAGTGPLVLTPSTKAYLDKYADHDAAVAVSYEGDRVSMWYCPVKGLGNCPMISVDPATIIDRCEEQAAKCGLYRYGEFVMWKGPVSVRGASVNQGTSRKSGSGLTELSRAQLCRISSSVQAGTAYWETQDSVQKYVIEAKSRDLTPKSCAMLLGLKLSNRISPTINDRDISKRLSKVKELLEKGLITPSEAERKRKDILNSL